MDRGARSHLLSWLLLPVSAALVFAALSLPRQPYSGLLLNGTRVVTVMAGGPAEHAGLAAGDRLIDPAASTRHLAPSPLARAAPGQPLVLLRERAADLREVRLVPERLPDGERRMMAALLVVASGFVLLGGWVWSERRDPLTRTFFLLCLAFASLLAPLPRGASAVAALMYDLLYTGVTLFLPALFLHFFALFPDAARPRGALASVTRIGYAVATALFAASCAAALAPVARGGWAEGAASLLQGMAAVWFAVGVLGALALFERSYRRARSADARRRLRVARIGTLLGAMPIAIVVVARNLFPGTPLPGERWTVVLTLLVPASFAWAVAVHRVFAFRVAVRTGAVLALLAVASCVAYLVGEWLAGAWKPELGSGIAGAALAFVALTASVAGPASTWTRALASRLVPADGDLSPAERLSELAAHRRGGALELLEAACAALTDALRLDGCAALHRDERGALLRAGMSRCAPLDGAVLDAVEGMEAVLGAGDPRLALPLRSALEAAGVSWVLVAGEGPRRTVLLLGHRLAGPWLGRTEERDLERFAHHLELLSENATLRRAARTHGALDRELSKAGAIQAHFLPRRAPAYHSLDCAAAALSCEPVGGDYYDFVEAGDATFTLAVGDAAGKGVPAALMGVWAHARFRDEARQGAPPSHVLRELNRELVGLDQPEAFVALLCARVDVHGGRVWFANAGLTPPLVRRRTGAYEEITESGVLLGVTRDAGYRDHPVDLEAGDLVVLYTDGLTEARREDELFGTERVREVLDASTHLDASGIVHALIDAARAFADGPLDDVTVVVLKQRTAVAQPAEHLPTGSTMTLKSARPDADAFW